MLRTCSLAPLLLLSLACGSGGNETSTDSDTGEVTGVTRGSTGQETTETEGETGSETGNETGTTTGGSGSESESDTSTSTTGVKLDVGIDTTTTDPTTTTDGNELGCEKVDILFVIDDSGSMNQEQDKLTDAFPQLMATIDEELVQEKNIDYRVGVMSTDMAGPDMCVLQFICGQDHRGRLQHSADRLNCAQDEPPGKWIETGPLQEVSNQFRCIASMDGGEFDEMPLEAARAGLVDRVFDGEGYNADFLRDDALLVLVIVTDEDDQSVWEVPNSWDLLFGPGPATPVFEYWNQFVELKGGESDRFVTVVLSGPKSGTCGGNQDEPGAVAAPRLHQFLELNLTNAYWGSICEDDYTTPLHEALDVIEAVCEVFPPPM
ncbi:MAG: hypothetical protein ACPG4T_13445 [Nannocystaceae bacterium]